MATTVTIDDLSIDHTTAHLKDLTVEFVKDPKKIKSNREKDKNTMIVLPDGRKVGVLPKFWITFCSLFDLNRNFTHYFSYAEVFERITAVTSKQVRLTIETVKDAPVSRLIACTGLNKPVIALQEAKNLIDAYSGTNLSYQNGMIQASFPCPFPQNLNISGDIFKTRFALRMPLDGYGLPSAYLELLREKNQGAVMGYTKAFKTQFQLGKDDANLIYVLDRAMSTFNNEEGYHAFIKRLESAAHSWASFYEAGTLKVAIKRAMLTDGWDIIQGAQIFSQYDAMTGNPLGYYGLNSDNEVSMRKAKTIPVQASVYQLILFAIELSSHIIKSQEAKTVLWSWIGEKISTEMDLEGTIESVSQFSDFFLNETRTMMGSNTSRVLYLE